MGLLNLPARSPPLHHSVSASPTGRRGKVSTLNLSEIAVHRHIPPFTCPFDPSENVCCRRNVQSRQAETILGQ